MKLRYQIERFAFWYARLLARILPRDLFLELGRSLGQILYRLDKRHQTIALNNFRLAFSDSTQEQAEATIRKCYEFFSGYLFDMLTCFPSLPPARMQKFDLEGMEHVEAAYKSGKGVIFFGGHFGAWELMALAQGASGFPLGLVVRKLDNPYLERLLEKLRVSTGNFIIDKNQGFRPMLKALREGKGLAVLMDQNVSTEDRVFVEFFGKPAATTPSVALLKLKTDAVLIPVSGHVLPGNRYHFAYGAPVEVPAFGDRQDDVRRITQECTRIIEANVRAHPECWLWMHRRWKTQPPEPVLA
jgi:KDO2-lipid IV(A) lauroyltransferase